MKDIIKKYCLILIIMISSKCVGQNNILFQKLKIDTTCQILNVPYFFGNGQAYLDKSFLINQASTIRKLLTSVEFGSKIDSPISENNNCNFYVIKNKKVINSFEINPRYKNIFLSDSDTSTLSAFEFEIESLLQQADIFPLYFYAKKFRFKTEDELNSFISFHSKQKNFICYKDETEVFSGKGEIYISRKNKLDLDQSEKLIEDEVRKLVGKSKDFEVRFSPISEKPNTFKFILYSSNAIYSQVNNSMFMKSEWKPNLKVIICYWKN